MGKYDAIIHMDPPKDTKHKPMSLENRAAQFAPFDALTGLGGLLHETSRITSERMELTEDAKSALNEKLNQIALRIREHLFLSVTYYVPDQKKTGGSYITVEGYAAKVNTYEKSLVIDTSSGERLYILFRDISEIEFIA